MNMQNSDSDWDSVTVLRKKTPKPSEARTAQAVNAALRHGDAVETSKKFSAASNKQRVMTQNAAKLDQETEELHHDHVDINTGHLIQQGRQAKNWTQKDLATQINEKPSLINDYEAGRAVVNQQILGKIERAIGIRLRGKDVGKPMPQFGAKKEEKK